MYAACVLEVRRSSRYYLVFGSPGAQWMTSGAAKAPVAVDTAYATPRQIELTTLG